MGLYFDSYKRRDLVTSKYELRTKAGFWKQNLKGEAAFMSYVPSDLKPDMEIVYTDRLVNKLAEAESALGKLQASFLFLSEDNRLSIVEKIRQREAELSWELSAGKGISQFEFEELFPPLKIGDSSRDEMDEEDIHNLKCASEYAKEALETLPISGRLLKNAHYLMAQSERYEKKYPGEFRSSPNWIGAPGATLTTANFVPPTGEDMDHAFGELEKFIHSESSLPILIKAALIHYQFETIHPFIDGNGRVGRILNTLYLIESGKISEDVLTFSYPLKRYSTRYYQEIEDVQQTGIYEKWIEFYLEMIKDAAEYSMKIMTLM